MIFMIMMMAPSSFQPGFTSQGKKFLQQRYHFLCNVYGTTPNKLNFCFQLLEYLQYSYSFCHLLALYEKKIRTIFRGKKKKEKYLYKKCTTFHIFSRNLAPFLNIYLVNLCNLLNIFVVHQCYNIHSRYYLNVVKSSSHHK